MGDMGPMMRWVAGTSVVVATIVAALIAVSFAGASKVQPEFIEGASNQGKDCADHVGSGQTWTQLKVDPNADGVYTDGTLTVTISNTQNDKTFDWSSNIGVDAVIVKGGSDGTYLYRYDPPGEQTSDTGLTTPGQNGISHINFCYDAPPPQQGRIIVEKQLIPDGYQPPQGGFVFTGAIQATLGDGQSAEKVVDPGTYTVTESLDGRPFWDLTSLVCDDGNSTGDLSTLTATYRVEAGETVRCVFTNTKRGLIIVKKLTDPAGLSGNFDFDASYDADGFTLSHGQQNVSPALKEGHYTVSEDTPAGWVLEQASCDNGDKPSDINLPADTVVTCTFVNAKQTKLTPTVTTDVHNASHATITSAVVGSTVHDSATVTGSGATPTGNVSFRVYLGNLQCAGDGSAAGTVALNGSGVAHPSDSAVVPEGGLSFRAHYEGDANYTSGNGPCETLEATSKLTPTVTTDVHNAQHSIVTSAPIGSTVHDSATVSGSGATPTGNVSFRVYLGNLRCSGDGSAAGTVALNGSGVAHPSNSAVVPVGGLSFRAHYEGDTNYTSGDGPCETLESTMLTPTVVTYVHNASHQVVTEAAIGSSVHDRADVTGSAGTPTGSVTFTVYLGNTTCSGENGQDAGTVALDGSGVAHPSSSVVVPTGGLSFRAHYGGDSTYTSGDGPCETLSAIPLTIGKGAIDVQKDATPMSLKEPGGQVTFSVSITNTSNVKVSILNVVDNVYGDLDDSGGNGCFDVPINLAPGASAHCQFAAMVTGTAGQDHVDTVTASGTDEFGNPVSDSDDAHVAITPKLIDLVIVKNATSPTTLNGTVTYTMTVTNKGPDTATNVQLADPAPAGIEYQSASPSQGSCAVGPALVTCNLGTLAAGQSATVTVTAKATTVGTHVNTATVTGSGGRETNPADNTDTAQTVVPAPLKPPTAKPTPPVVEVCLSMTVTPKMITADGKPDRVRAKVRAGHRASRGTKVVIRGVGIYKTGRTNAQGIAVIRINPKKPGLITITTLDKNESCGAKRIGVVGVFLPPLTG